MQRVGSGEVHLVRLLLPDGYRQQLREPHQRLDRLGVAARLGEGDDGVVRLDEPLRGGPGVFRVGPRRPREAELVTRREARRAGHRLHGDLAGDGHVHGPLGVAHGDLQQAADHQARVVLVLQPMVVLGVLPEDLALVAGLLHPLDAGVAAAAHRAGVGAGAGAGGDEHRVPAAPRGVYRRAVVQRADVDVDGGGGGLAGDHRVAERGVQRRALVRHRHQPGRGPFALAGLGRALLEEGDLRPGHEEEVVDAAQLHGGHEGVGPLVRAVLAPGGLEGPWLARRHGGPPLLCCLLRLVAQG